MLSGFESLGRSQNKEGLFANSRTGPLVLRSPPLSPASGQSGLSHASGTWSPNPGPGGSPSLPATGIGVPGVVR